MFNLDNAIVVMDAHINCGYRHCDECELLFGINDCPTRVYHDQFKEVLRLLEKARDSAPLITEEDIIKLLRG